jgi:rhamnose transport system ATP-binding protein
LRAVGDRVTILRDGATVHTSALKDLTREELIQHMVGRPVSAIYQRQPQARGEVLLEARHLSRGILDDISLDLHAGEIVGLAGLMGAGRTELCRVLFGLDPPRKGAIRIGGKPLSLKTPRDAVAAGIALIPEDRQHHGLALKLPVAFNMTMPDLARVSSFGFLKRSDEIGLADQYRERLRIRCQSPRQLAGRLSGGNQQKVVIAKWVARGARIFLFDEPTRGIDVAAKQEVFEEMDGLARSGAAILMVSSELPELIQVADRILVMSNGRITGELPGRTTQEEIMRLAAPLGESAAHTQKHGPAERA